MVGKSDKELYDHVRNIVSSTLPNYSFRGDSGNCLYLRKGDRPRDRIGWHDLHVSLSPKEIIPEYSDAHEDAVRLQLRLSQEGLDLRLTPAEWRD